MNSEQLTAKVKSICHELNYQQGIIASVDVLQKLDYLSKEDYLDWRNGRIPYLERVCKTNLSKLTMVNQTIRKVAAELKLKPTYTIYKKYGKVPMVKLRFSKSGDERIEVAYSTHYVDVTHKNNKKKNDEPIVDENENKKN